MTATPLFTAIVGSHLWGHETPSSDVDHFAVFADDPQDILSGLSPTRGHQRIFPERDGVLYDVHSMEVGHFVDLLIKSNPNAIFAAMSHHIVDENERYSVDIADLREIVRGTMAKAIYPPIRGMAMGYASRAESGVVTDAERAKCLLGGRRVLAFGERYLDGEIAFGPTDPTIADPMALFRAAYDRSTLPDRAPAEPYRDWLLGLRLAMLEDR